MLGMTTAMVGSSTWVILATMLKLPVSTTHAIVGAFIGVGVASGASEAIKWGWDGLGQIVASWFISPVLAGFVSAAFFLFCREVVLKHSDAYARAKKFIAFYFFFTFFVITFFVAYKGAPNLNLDSLGIEIVLAIAFGTGNHQHSPLNHNDPCCLTRHRPACCSRGPLPPHPSVRARARGHAANL
jgi:phosphate/sulfate permease